MSRTMDRQREWIMDLDFLDRYWAKNEIQLRTEAKRIREQLNSGVPGYPGGGRTARLILPNRDRRPVMFQAADTTTFYDPVSSYEDHVIEVYPVGGDEELLLIEECLRRAIAGVGW